VCKRVGARHPKMLNSFALFSVFGVHESLVLCLIPAMKLAAAENNLRIQSEL
jgi:hypothetical protein